MYIYLQHFLGIFLRTWFLKIKRQYIMGKRPHIDSISLLATRLVIDISVL